MRIGIIGCGGISPLHVKVYQKMKDVEVVSLCDISIDRAKNMASKFGIKNTYSDYWQMFEKENLDYVDICTPASTHAKIVSDAATAQASLIYSVSGQLKKRVSKFLENLTWLLNGTFCLHKRESSGKYVRTLRIFN